MGRMRKVVYSSAVDQTAYPPDDGQPPTSLAAFLSALHPLDQQDMIQGLSIRASPLSVMYARHAMENSRTKELFLKL
jgi:hypothetical protein